MKDLVKDLIALVGGSGKRTERLPEKRTVKTENHMSAGSSPASLV